MTLLKPLNKLTVEDKIKKYFPTAPTALTFLNIYQKSFLETLEQTLLKQTVSESSTLYIS